MKAGALIAVLAAAAVLVWLYVSLKPETPAPVTRPAAPEAAAHEFVLALKGGQLTGPAVMRVNQGTSVLIRVTSDHADELHLHGYDLSLALRAGEPGVLAFTADKAGRFDVELHHAHLELGALEVQPK